MKIEFEKDFRDIISLKLFFRFFGKMNRGVETTNKKCKSLYSLSLSIAIKNFERFKCHFLTLCHFIIVDAFFLMSSEGRIGEIWKEMGNFIYFTKMLKAKRQLVHTTFQACVNFNPAILKNIVQSFSSYCLNITCENVLNDTYNNGIELSEFLNEAGWWRESTQVLVHCEKLVWKFPGRYKASKVLDCHSRLLNGYTKYMDIEKATEAYDALCCFMEICDNYQKTEDGDDDNIETMNGVEDKRIPKTIDFECNATKSADSNAEDVEMDMNEADYKDFNALQMDEGQLFLSEDCYKQIRSTKDYENNLALNNIQNNKDRSNPYKKKKAKYKKDISKNHSLNDPSELFTANQQCLCLARCSAYLYALERFHMSYQLAMRALAHLTDKHPKKTIVEVLTQVARCCEVKRHYKEAEVIIKYAVNYVRQTYGKSHLCYAVVLEHYGFILTSLHRHNHAHHALKTCVQIYDKLLPGPNLRVALACVEFAYSCYFKGYNRDNFGEAFNQCIRAIKMMNAVLPLDHPLIASATRLQSLLLNETNHPTQSHFFTLCLLNKAINLSASHLGADSWARAKYYDDLGRHFTVTEDYKKAEIYFKKAIESKQRLMGTDDPDLALSLGHLASFYLYAMRNPSDALPLYLKSIEILKHWFGPNCIALRHAYSGLMEVYKVMRDQQKLLYYQYLANQIIINDNRENELDFDEDLVFPLMINASSTDLNQCNSLDINNNPLLSSMSRKNMKNGLNELKIFFKLENFKLKNLEKKFSLISQKKFLCLSPTGNSI